MEEKIMEKPDDVNLDWLYYRLFTCNEVIGKFYFQGIWKENYIPNVLRERNWMPEEGKLYRCWYKWTNPADPADPGEDHLVYIEESPIKPADR